MPHGRPRGLEGCQSAPGLGIGHVDIDQTERIQVLRMRPIANRFACMCRSLPIAPPFT